MIAAVIPALNEERTIGNVVRAVRMSGLCADIIVVSDGSTDHTAERARGAGATLVIEHDKPRGKAHAMQAGVKATEADVILFCDADLIGFTPGHVDQIVAPVVGGQCAMNVGLRDRGKLFFAVGEWLPLIGGERALRREVFEKVPPVCKKGYMIEVALNYVCRKKNWKIMTTPLPGLIIRKKTDKVGVLRGMFGYTYMTTQVVRALFALYSKDRKL